MQNKTKSIFHKWQTVWLLALFFGIRVGSFLLREHLIIQGILAFALLMLLAALYFKSPLYAWYLILGEIFLGGTGHFLELGGLSIRTIFIGTFLLLWIIHALGTNTYKFRLHIPHRVYYPLIPLGLFVLFATIHGLTRENGLHAVVSDLIPYSFLLLVFPAYYLFQKEKSQHIFIRLVIVFIIGSALFALYNFILFSAGWEILHDPYYNWFRDVVMGKITNMGNGFFRIVTPAHLLFTPIALIISSLLMRDEKHHWLWRLLLTLALLILILNFSRAYLLGLCISLLLLAYTHSIKKWLTESIILVFTICILFFSIN